jgi:hypothetical protein
MKCFRCNHSGKLLPADYVDQWGRKYGHGLGPIPVSECLDVAYGKLPDIDRPSYASIDDLMYPLQDTHAGISPCEVGQVEAGDPESWLILAKDDPTFSKRIAVIKEIQNERPEMVALQTRVELRQQSGK